MALLWSSFRRVESRKSFLTVSFMYTLVQVLAQLADSIGLSWVESYYFLSLPPTGKSKLLVLDAVDARYFASNTPPQPWSLHSWTFSSSQWLGYYKCPKILIINFFFEHPGFLSDFRICGLVNDKIPALVAQSEITREITTITMSGLWRTKGEAPPCQLSIRTNALSMPLVELPRARLPPLLKLSLRVSVDSEGDYRLKAAHYLLESGCNTPNLKSDVWKKKMNATLSRC